VGVDGLAGSFLVVGNGLEKAVEVLVDATIVLDECLVSLGQISIRRGRVVPSERRVVQMQLVVFVVGEAGKLLNQG